MTIAIRGVTLIDGTGAEPVADATVLVDGDRVVAAGHDAGTPSDATVVDGSGLTLTPGLIDAHVHLGLSVDIEADIARTYSIAEVAAAIFENCRQTLDAGFTTVRDTGGIDGGVVRAVESGRAIGPRIVQCGPILCETGGHGHFCSSWEPVAGWMARIVPGLYGLSVPVDGPDEVRKAARENFRRGAEFIKLCVTGGVVSKHDRLSDTQFTVEEIAAAVGEANARGTYVTVHAHNNQGIRNAIAAGVRCVEHGTSIDDEVAALMAANGVALVPTMTVAHLLAEDATRMGLAPEIGERVRGCELGMANAIRVARAAGVKVGSGSDLIGPEQTQRGLELQLRSAVTDPMEALVAATRVNAEIIGLGDDVGTVTAGRVADLVLWASDPLDDPATFNRRDAAVLVMQSGRIVKDTRT